MNDMGSAARFAAQRAGGIGALDATDFNAFLRRTPYNRDGYVRPIDAAANAETSVQHEGAIPSVVRSPLYAPDRIRTCDLRFRRPTLYPAELRAHWVLQCKRRGRDSNPRWGLSPILA